MKSKAYILSCFLLFMFNGYSQNNKSPFMVWKLYSWSGQLNVKGAYGFNQTKQDNIITNKQSGAYLSGGVIVRTRSFFVHPNFMDVTINAVLNPETKRNYAVGMPDYSEKIRTEALDYSIHFLRKKKFSLTTRGGINSGYSNIDNISRVKHKGKYLGAMLSSPNKLLPYSLVYSFDKFEQKIIESNRLFTTEQQLIQAMAHKSFTDFDNTTVDYQHSNTKNFQNDNNVNSSTGTRVDYDQLNINNGIYFHFDKKKNYSFNSTINSLNALGSIKINSLAFVENISLRLPQNLFWSNTYNFSIIQQNLYNQGLNKNNNQSFQSGLHHQLFTSLATQLNFIHSENKQNSSYSQQRNSYGLNFTYTKKIPTGNLMIIYIFNKDFQSIKTPTTTLNIFHEDYILSDSSITLLKNQNINMQSIVVKDAAGTVYQLNTDYLLLDRNPYIEIVRVPGGWIANNSAVYIDYIVVKPGLFKYTSNNHAISANISLFRNKFNLTYSFSKQDFFNVSKSDIQILNYFIRHTVVARVDFIFINGGVEYDYNKSTITPYQAMKYYIKYQKMFKKLHININGNLLDMQMTNEKARRQNIDFSCKLAYPIFQNVIVDFDYSYRIMKGRGLNLDVQTARLNMTANLLKFYVSLGADFFLNKSNNNEVSYKGTYIQLTRNF